jgi:uncharacterized protein YuzE
MTDRLPPPPFWRTRYFALEVMARADRRDIDVADVNHALIQPTRKQRQPDGRVRYWCWVSERGRWLRVVTEADGETVHKRILGPELRAMNLDPTIRYYPETDTMAIEIRPWPESSTGDTREIGGQDAGEDLVVHYAADGQPWLWEIEHASMHPEHIAAALEQIRQRSSMAA